MHLLGLVKQLVNVSGQKKAIQVAFLPPKKPRRTLPDIGQIIDSVPPRVPIDVNPTPEVATFDILLEDDEFFLESSESEELPVFEDKVTFGPTDLSDIVSDSFMLKAEQE